MRIYFDNYICRYILYIVVYNYTHDLKYVIFTMNKENEYILWQ